MPDPRPPRILIADDEAAQMKALCNVLSEQGYETVGCPGGRPALEAVHGGGFDLLLADLAMPDMDGIALSREALVADPNIVVVIMTGEGSIATAVEAMKVGAVDYVLKPFRLSAILPVLARALEIRRLRVENAELGRRIREHAAELEAANKELDAFSASVSHDLRAPLRAVRSFAGFLAQEARPTMNPEAQQNLDRIVGAAARMDRLIEDMLRFARMSRAPMSKQRVDMRSLVLETIETLQSESGERHIDVLVGDLPDAVGDPALVRQIVVNLLSNAFKFTREREPAVIEVGCRQVRDCTYFVRDNGAGFDMQYANRLFGVFQRLHGAKEFEGTGVGLSIVQRIVSRHGGRIWAEAEINKGAAFYFTLERSTQPGAE